MLPARFLKPLARIALGPWCAAVVIASAGCATTAWLCTHWRHVDADKLERAFDARANDRFNQIRTEFDRQTIRLEHLAGLYHASKSVEADEFREFGSHILKDPAVKALFWIERQPVPAAADRFPVTLVEPRNANAALLGEDAATLAAWRETLETARDIDATMSVRASALAVAGRDGSECFIFQPIYRNGAPHETIAERRENLVGFVGECFQVSRLVCDAMGGLSTGGIDTRIYESLGPDSGSLVFLHKTRHGITPEERRRAAAMSLPEPIINGFRVGQRPWSVVCRPTPGVVRALDGSAAPWFAVNGMLLTLAATAWTFGNGRRRQTVERLVEERTAELSKEVAERTAAEVTLRRSRAQLAEAQRLAHLGSWDWDLRTNVVEWSEELYRISGRTREDFSEVIDGFWKCVHPDDAALVRQHIEHSLATLAPFDLPFRMVRPDGTVRTLHSHGIVAVDAAGRPVRLYGASQDITERRAAEEQKAQLLAEVWQQRKRLADILASVPGLVWEAWGAPDAAGQRINFVSVYVETMLGYSVEQWLATPNFWLSIVHADDRERAAREGVAIFAGGKGGNVQFRWIHQDGRSVWTEAYAVVICDESGAPVGLRGVCLDVTARKAAEQELANAQKELVAASRQAGMAEVATSVLHNVGNVLNSVNISVGIAKEKVDQISPSGLSRVAALLHAHAEDLPGFFANHPQGPRLPGYLAQIAAHLAEDQKSVLGELDSLRKNVEHINEIVAMQQSYATGGGVTETLPLADLVEDALRMNSAAFERHGTSLVCEFDRAIPPVAVDRNKVLLILVNLLRNARYACDDVGRSDGCVTIRTHRNGDGLAKISVQDNGVGIPRENLTRIFEHGFTTRKNGHGFGLHSSALAASELGGALRVHSPGSGLGATFTLEIPVSPDRR